VDAFDAMTSDRPYRKALPIADVIREFKENAGKQFNPKLTAIFLKMLNESSRLKTNASSLETESGVSQMREICIRSSQTGIAAEKIFQSLK